MAGNLTRAKALAAEHRVMPGFRSNIAFREGDWEAAIEMNLPMLDWARRTGHRWDEVDSLATLCALLRITGDFQRAAEFFQQLLRASEPSDLWQEMRIRPSAALLAIEAGRSEEAVQHLEVCRAIVAQGEDWLGMISAVERAEAMLAAAQNRDLTPHFEKSIANLKRYSLPWDEADTPHYWGVALNTAGEYSNANEKFDAAVEMYRRLGAGQRWIDRAEAAKHSSVPAPKAHKPAATSPDPAIFRKEGEFWTLAYQGATVRLRDIKGLAYIAVLLAHPGERFHAKELVTIVGGASIGKSANGSLAGHRS